MKNTKSTIKFFLVIALFASSVMADGQMNGGGKSCDSQTQNCLVSTQPGVTKENSIIVLVKEFLASLLG